MFNWQQLLHSQRIGGENRGSKEFAFDSDYKRIVTSPAFRRLQDKTQVFPLERHDFVHTRLTHSIEVAMLARELATNIIQYYKGEDAPILNERKEDICRILECASLLHDIGNPPFGHFGEDIIRHWFASHLAPMLQQKMLENINIEYFLAHYLSDFIEFDGNAQALRIITKLHNFSGDPGMHLTAATINTMIKYTRSSTEAYDKQNAKLVEKKMGYFQAEQKIFEKVTALTGVEKARHPLTFILEAADDIAYLTADIEDALKKELFSFDFFKQKLTEFNQQWENLKDPKDNDKNKYLNEVHKQQTKNQEDGNQEELINQCFFDIRKKLIYAASFSFNHHYSAIMQGNYNADLFKGSWAETLHKFLRQFALKHIFSNKHILKLEISGHSVLTFLLNKFVAAVLPYADLNNIHNKLDKKLVALISESHKQIYQRFATKHQDDPHYLLYLRLLMVTDFISGMTDSYAHDLYTTLSGYHI
ncbi:dGTPase [Volucribacter psittacicida]|uniref:dGTPase n=1 Tax=Volucribacter psittacicida TaxID=203482 RepID=A0A4R1FN33_9PAST|nr:dNTP triphosphohydrolase [Volucribacter psittacicida]TCJ94794.1 dGTPase [Volucribacter psittacicida]